MNITHELKENYLQVFFEGDLALDGVYQAERYLDRLFETPDWDGMLINLKDTRYIDSQGISLIIVTYRQLTEEGKKFILCNLDKEQSTLLKSLAIDKVIPLSNSEEEAFELLKTL